VFDYTTRRCVLSGFLFEGHSDIHVIFAVVVYIVRDSCIFFFKKYLSIMNSPARCNVSCILGWIHSLVLGIGRG
jgi:hypothetical protein